MRTKDPLGLAQHFTLKLLLIVFFFFFFCLNLSLPIFGSTIPTMPRVTRVMSLHVLISY